jgi:hypothetical protein
MTDFRLFFTQSKQAPLRKNYAIVHSPHRRPAVLPGQRFSGFSLDLQPGIIIREWCCINPFG